MTCTPPLATAAPVVAQARGALYRANLAFADDDMVLVANQSLSAFSAVSASLVSRCFIRLANS